MTIIIVNLFYVFLSASLYTHSLADSCTSDQMNEQIALSLSPTRFLAHISLVKESVTFAFAPSPTKLSTTNHAASSINNQ